MVIDNAAMRVGARHELTLHVEASDASSSRPLDAIAQRIVREIRPRTVLCVGSDSAELALELVKHDLRVWAVDGRGASTLPHDRAAPPPTATAMPWNMPLRQTYDLIICLDVLAQLPDDEATQAIENLCQYTGDMILASPPDNPAVAATGTNAPVSWTQWFAAHDFFRDVDYDATFIAPLAIRLRRTTTTLAQVIGTYENRLWRLDQESLARRRLSLEHRTELAQKLQLIRQLTDLTEEREQAVRERDRDLSQLRAQFEERTQAVRDLRSQFAEKAQAVLDLQEQFAEKARKLLELQSQFADKKRTVQELTGKIAERDEAMARLESHVKALEAQLTDLQSGFGWMLLQRARVWRLRLAPRGSRRERTLSALFRGVRVWRRYGMIEFQRRVRQKLSLRTRVLWWRLRTRGKSDFLGEEVEVPPVATRPPLAPRQATATIVICVHNALADVERCLESVLAHTSAPYSLLLVDDGSDEATQTFLETFAAEHQATLLRNEQPQGYTRAANRGLRHAKAEFVVLLNSDTIVTPGWLDRMIACAQSDPQIGMVGPLSNTASWQSIPEIESLGDWADNPLPPGTSPEDVGRYLAHASARLYPRLSFLNGFCLLLRRQMIDALGYFDEENFGAGYGEENDYCLRAGKQGWQLCLADDAYVYHAQSRSYSHEARKRLCDRAGEVLARKHDPHLIERGVAQCRENRVLAGIRARSRQMFVRESLRRQGRERFAGKRVLYVLPICAPGGGGNIVLLEAAAMRRMKVDVAIFNLLENRSSFRRAYPELDMPILYGEVSDLPRISQRFDAVIATHNSSVYWLAPIGQGKSRPVRGYYIQDFEPYFYPSHSEQFAHAWGSYSLFPDMVRFTKTDWTRDEVHKRAHVDAVTVGASVDVDLYRPRPRTMPDWPDRPLRIAAMVRPESSHRGPVMTMRVLADVAAQFGPAVQMVLFGTTSDNLLCLPGGRDFAWQLAGILSPSRMANLLNEVDVFVDFSTYQAMGLTALEAMCCGAATIVPTRGGAHSFARHEHNALLVDTSSYEACRDALVRLCVDNELRRRVQKHALDEAVAFVPERPALNTLIALFSPPEAPLA